MIHRSISAITALLVLLTVVCLAQSGSDCKPVERYGVKGCEIRPDRTCPAGYHEQAVNPPNPRMGAPTFLMCVPDKKDSKDNQPPKEEKPKQQKPETPPKN